MKKQIFMSFLLSLVISMSVSAQRGELGRRGEGEPRTATERATTQTNALEKKLGLSAEQKAKIYEINLSAATKNEELRASRQEQMGKNEELRNARVENEKARDAAIQAVLNTEQNTKYAEMKELRKEKMEERKGMKGKNGRGKGKFKESEGDDDGDDN